METRAIEIGYKFNVPIYVVLSSGNVKGTWLKEYGENMGEKIITGLTVSENNLIITINNVLFKANTIAKIFERIAQKNINIDMISQTAPINGYINISFTANKDDLEAINDVIAKIREEILGIEVSIELNISKVSLVGIGMMNQSGVTARVFKILADNDIEFKQVTTSEISISFAIDVKDKHKAAHVLAKELNL